VSIDRASIDSLKRREKKKKQDKTIEKTAGEKD
jgi:hypothetical protein